MSRAWARALALFRGRAAGARETAPAPLPPGLGAVDLLVTHNEVNTRHGTGVLLWNLFGAGGGVLSLRSVDTYGGEQSFGAAAARLPALDLPRAAVSGYVERWLEPARVRCVICVPFYPVELDAALAAAERCRAPLCLYCMDDHSLCDRVIPRALMREAASAAVLCLAISPEMQAAYTREYRRPFWLLPPLVSEALVRPGAAEEPAAAGILIGNVWFQAWLDALCRTLRGSGVRVDWYCNSAAPPGLRFDAAALERDGIRFHPPLEPAALAAVLPRYSFALVPSGTRRQSSAARAIAALSLPSRIPFALAVSQTPVIVLGDNGGAAAGFVTRHGVGLASGYSPEEFRRAAAAVAAPDSRAAMRDRAARLAPLFSAAGAGDWLRRGIELGRPPDLRYEDAFSLRP